ncbi:MAG: DUF86 domain-containing protein [Actinobacteria bacterium]|nr:DUF86 domain-containing protein [Actinomycetota bacterium]
MTAGELWLADLVGFCDEITDLCAVGRDTWRADTMRVAATSYVLIKAAHAAEQAIGKPSTASNEPWHRLVGIRHRLAHDYRHVELDLLWQVAANRIPEVRAAAIEALRGSCGTAP